MTFLETILGHLAHDGRRPAITEHHADGARVVTRADLRAAVGRARGGLRAHGVRADDRVVLVGPNGADWVACDLAILAEGATVVPLYARQDPAELAGMIADCAPRVVVAATEALAEALEDAGVAEPIVRQADVLDADPVDAPPAPRAPEDIATFCYTSGTSGEPKGAMITFANVGHMLPVTSDALAELMGQAPGSDRVFHYLPFGFMGSRIVLWTTLFRGNPLDVSVDLDRLLDEVASAQPHYFLNVPVLLERVKNGADAALATKPAPVRWLYARAQAAFARRVTGEAGRRDRLALALAERLIFRSIRGKLGPNLRFLICGSAPLGEDTQRWFEMLGVAVYQVYGLTETTAIVTMDQPGRVVPGRVGLPIRGCEVRLTEAGELQCRGDHVFAGYWNKPEATAAAFDGAWFRTGDQADRADDGTYAIIGRLKNLLVPSSGHNVAPEPIEQKLVERIPGVEQAVLWGHARPHLTALVTGPVDAAALEAGVAAVNATLPHYKRVRAWHHRPEPLTDAEGLLTANGKLKRAAIEAHFAATIDALYAQP